jgi:hypothetical protein
MKAIRSSVACLAVLTFILSFAATAEEQTPFNGAPMLIPGHIEAENFDNGGEGKAYHDTDVGNNGGYYRATDVDLAKRDDFAERLKAAYIGWTRAGEWVEYTVDVQQEGYYFVEVGVASYRPGGTFHIAFDGIDKTGPLTVPDTGGWRNWRVVAKAAVYLHAGTQVMSLVMDSNGISGSVANIDDIDFFPSVASIPGNVQAERFNDGSEGVAYHDTDAGNNGSYYRAADVDVDVDRDDPFNRSYIGWTESGEWVEYAVNVQTAGYYSVTASVASQGQGGTFHIEFNGVDATGMFTVPDTGGWRKWQSITTGSVYLTAGPQVMRLMMHDTGPSGSIGNIDLLTFALQQRPTIPGGVEAVDFNQGGEGIAYHDVDPVNRGGYYRQDGVDIDLVGSTYYVGWTEAGEWLAYTVDVLATGYYRFEVDLASNGRGGTFHIEFDGVDKTGTFAVPDTGGWRKWERLYKENIFLTAGTYTMRIVMDTNGPSGSVANISRVDVRNAGLPFTFNGAPAEIPGYIEAEDFDTGGEGVSYHDTGPGNNGVHYRDTGVDIDGVPPPQYYENYYVGWTAAGEWLNYSVNVATPGSFTVVARVASAGQGGTFHIEFDGVDVTGDFNVPDTGGWRYFYLVSLSKTGVYLSAGPHVMRIALDSIGPSGSVANLDYLSITREWQ